MRLKVFIVFFLFIGLAKIYSQQNVTTFGIQIKPIVPLSFIGEKEQDKTVNAVDFSISPRLGYSFGMVARRGISKMFSFETGINVSRRNYELSIKDQQDIYKSKFRFISYDVPILALLYIQLGDQMYMNTAFGVSVDFLPSDWQTIGQNYRHLSLRNEWVMPSLLANIGFEYRTYKSGYIYFGASYHRPFAYLTNTNVAYYRNGNVNDIENYDAIANFKLNGSYLTLDLRYFFYEKPIRKKKKQKK